MMENKKMRYILEKIAYYNSIYRSKNKSPIEKLLALWEIGDILLKNNIKNPHSFGWEIQRMTDGIIKRPTIFRGYKYRQIWSTKEDLLRDCEGLKSLSNIVDSIPFLDPNQKNKYNISSSDMAQLKKSIKNLNRQEFIEFINNLKEKYRTGQLGRKQNRNKYLNEIYQIYQLFMNVYKLFSEGMKESNYQYRETLRNNICDKDLDNLVLILSSIIFHKSTDLDIKKITFNTKVEEFNKLGLTFKAIILNKNQIFQNKLEKMIPKSKMIDLLDMLNSIKSEKDVKQYNKRKNIKLKIY
jgi:hypothetical protein